MPGKWDRIEATKDDVSMAIQTEVDKSSPKKKNQAIIYYATQGIPDDEIAKMVNTSLAYVKKVKSDAQKMGIIEQPPPQPPLPPPQLPQLPLPQPEQQVLPPIQQYQPTKPQEEEFKPATLFPLPHVPGLHPNEVLNKFLSYARIYGKGGNISPQMAELIAQQIQLEYALQAARSSSGGGEMQFRQDGYTNDMDIGMKQMLQMLQSMRLWKLQEKMAKAMGLIEEDSDLRKELEALKKERQEEEKIRALKEELREIKEAIMKGGNDKELTRLKELEKKIEEMKEDRRTQELKLILEAQKKSIDDPFLKMYMERDSKIDEIRRHLDETKTQLLATQMQSALEKLEDRINQLGGGPKIASQLAEIKETVSAIKELGKELSGTKEKSGAEMVKDIIGDVTDKIKEPVLRPLGEAISEKIKQAREQPQQIFIPAEQIESVQQVQQIQKKPIKLEAPEYENLINVTE
jgi:hypothetical protein